MTCSCPKCHVLIEIDIPKNETGAFMPCPDCKSRFWVAREAYSRMALKKEGKVYCDQCGKELGHKIVCGACGVMYPDYYLVQSSKPPRRQVEKRDIFSLSFSLKPSKPTQAYEYTYASTKTSTGWSIGIRIQKFAVVAVVLIIAASLGYYYQLIKMEKQFARNYMRALYTIKTGNDLSLDICAKISADWKSKGQYYVPRINSDDEAKLNKVKEVANRYMQKLNTPPKKFLSNKERLVNLYNAFSKARDLAVAPSGTPSSFDSAVAKSQNVFNSSIASLKENMSGTLSKEFQVARIKYKRLQNI